MKLIEKKTKTFLQVITHKKNLIIPNNSEPNNFPMMTHFRTRSGVWPTRAGAQITQLKDFKFKDFVFHCSEGNVMRLSNNQCGGSILVPLITN